jgi:hypothetical protein
LKTLGLHHLLLDRDSSSSPVGVLKKYLPKNPVKDNDTENE